MKDAATPTAIFAASGREEAESERQWRDKQRAGGKRHSSRQEVIITRLAIWVSLEASPEYIAPLRPYIRHIRLYILPVIFDGKSIFPPPSIDLLRRLLFTTIALILLQEALLIANSIYDIIYIFLAIS